MEADTTDPITSKLKNPTGETVFAVLFAISFSHMLNDTIQALIPSLYPIIKDSLRLSYSQLGLITFTFQCTASLLQPVVGLVTDRKPMPWSLAIGMGFTLVGLILLSLAHSFPMTIFSAAMVGLGSACSIPRRRGWRTWRRGRTGGLRNRSSRWAGMRGVRWGRCWRRSSSDRAGRGGWRGFRWRPAWGYSCCGGSGVAVAAPQQDSKARCEITRGTQGGGIAPAHGGFFDPGAGGADFFEICLSRQA